MTSRIPVPRIFLIIKHDTAELAKHEIRRRLPWEEIEHTDTVLNHHSFVVYKSLSAYPVIASWFCDNTFHPSPFPNGTLLWYSAKEDMVP